MLRNASRHVCQRSLGLPDIVPKSGFPFRRLTSLNIEGLGPNIFSYKGFVCPLSWTSPQKKHGFVLPFSPTLLFITNQKPTKDDHPHQERQTWRRRRWWRLGGCPSPNPLGKNHPRSASRTSFTTLGSNLRVTWSEKCLMGNP